MEEKSKIKQEELMSLLKELEGKTALEASAVVTKDGMRLACSVSAEMDADMFSAAAAAMVNLGSMTIRRLNQGKLKEIIVRGDEGYTMVTDCGSDLMLVAAGRESFRLGYYLGVLKKYARDVAKIMDITEKKVEPTPAEIIAAQVPPMEPAPVEMASTDVPPADAESTEVGPTEIIPTPSEEPARPSEEEALEPEPAEAEPTPPTEAETTPSDKPTEDEDKSALEAERKAILEALKALGWEESSGE
ncbi:MAG: roadblock/LC7 domain-containing protein [Candidatus Hodarchaeota archaeon]